MNNQYQSRFEVPYNGHVGLHLRGSPKIKLDAFALLYRRTKIHQHHSSPSVDIHHPAWPEGVQGLFLRLKAFDHHHSDGTTPMCYFRTVWSACAIVSGNSFDGYISLSRVPSADDKIIEPAGPDDLLKVGKYYFHVLLLSDEVEQANNESEAYHYPIYRDF